MGWYYIPVNNKKPTWMDPYLNSNINVYMVSYVIPIYIDGESIGIIGMDIDFRSFTDVLSATSLFDTGYAFLANADGNIMYHKELEVGTQLRDADSGLSVAADAIADEGKAGTCLSYSYQGQEKKMCFVTLTNGMRYVMTAPEEELLAQAEKNTGLILGGAVIALVLSVVIGVALGFGITKPIAQINGIVQQTAEFEFTHQPYDWKYPRTCRCYPGAFQRGSGDFTGKQKTCGRLEIDYQSCQPQDNPDV